jgi:hypothetical protein
VSIFLEQFFFEKFDKNSPFFEKKSINSIKAKNIFYRFGLTTKLLFWLLWHIFEKSRENAKNSKIFRENNEYLTWKVITVFCLHSVYFSRSVDEIGNTVTDCRSDKCLQNGTLMQIILLSNFSKNRSPFFEKFEKCFFR